MKEINEYLVTASNGFYFNGRQWVEDGYVFDDSDKARYAFVSASNMMQVSGADVTIFLVQKSTPYDDNTKSYDYEMTKETVLDKKHLSLD